MKRGLLIRPEAERDLAEGLAWYEEQRPGLGREFILAVEALLETIERYPESHPRVHGNTRRALLRRFPYGVEWHCRLCSKDLHRLSFHQIGPRFFAWLGE